MSSFETVHWRLYLVAYRDKSGAIKTVHVKAPGDKPYSAYERWRRITGIRDVELISITYLWDTSRPEPDTLT